MLPVVSVVLSTGGFPAAMLVMLRNQPFTAVR
jgi:hypothetical protein